MVLIPRWSLGDFYSITTPAEFGSVKDLVDIPDIKIVSRGYFLMKITLLQMFWKGEDRKC